MNMMIFPLFLLLFFVRADFEVDGFTYHIIDSSEKTVQVSACSILSDTTIKIPSKVKYDNADYSVISISKSAFSLSNARQFDTIYFPYTLKDIEEETFYGFINLTKVGYTDEKGKDIDDTLPPLITVIHPNTFYRTSLKTITASSVTELETACFGSCSSLVSAKFSSDLTLIGDESFYGCILLESFDIGTKATEVGTSSFRTCYSLKTIDLQNVKTVYNYAFQYCSQLNSINLRSVEVIAEYVFADLETLNSIDLPSTLRELHSYCFMRTPLKTVTGNPEKVTEIKSSFAFCESLVSVPSFKGLEVINKESFYYCSNLERFECGEKLNTIGQNAFSYCGKLTSLLSESKNLSVDFYSFRGCGALKTFQFDSLVSMANNSFESCTGFEKVDFSENSKLREITYHAFFRCSNLKEVVLPPNMASINSTSPFQDCPIEKVTFKGTSGLVSIGMSFANFASLREVTFEDSCQVLLNSTFSGCTNLSSVTLPTTDLTLINTFNGCTSLEKVVNFNAAVKIEGTFKNCVSLKNLEEVTQIETVGDMTFEGCTNLTSLHFSNKLTSIGKSAFKNCTSLATIEGVSEVTTVGEMCFENCIVLESPHFTNKLTTVGNRAFRNCYALTTIETAGIEAVGEMSFENCFHITSLHFGHKLTTIGDQAFADCTSISSVTFASQENANSIISIGIRSFESCSKIESVFIEKVESVKISEGAFKDCKLLTGFNYTVFDSISIGDSAFTNCPLTESIQFNSTTISISHHSFSSSLLKTVEFTPEVKNLNVESDSFSDCTNVNCVIVEDSLISEVKKAFNEKVINGEFCPGSSGSSGKKGKKIALIAGISAAALVVLIVLIVIIVVVRRRRGNYQQIDNNQSILFNTVKSKN